MLTADAPGTYANGIGTNLDIVDRVGDAPLSTANSQSYNIIPDNKIPYVPRYFGLQTTNTHSMTFDGINDYFSIAAPLYQVGTGDVTISAWANTSTTEVGNVDIFGLGDNAGTTSEIRLQRQADKFGAYINSTTASGQRLEGVTTISTGQWYNVVLIKSSNVFTLYLNGVPDSNITWVGGALNGDGGVIGAYWGGGSNQFSGQIDEVAIFDKALTPDQIKFDLYEPSLPLGSNKTADIADNPDLPTPVAWYRMGD
jgi:hypothetical protein